MIQQMFQNVIKSSKRIFKKEDRKICENNQGISVIGKLFEKILEERIEQVTESKIDKDYERSSIHHIYTLE